MQGKGMYGHSELHKLIHLVLMLWKDACNANKLSIQLPHILLDACHVHQIRPVVNYIQSMGVEVVDIPVGAHMCTSPSTLGLIHL